MKVYELITQVASKLGGGYNGSVTTGATTYLVDTKMKSVDGYFSGGTVIMRTGDNKGQCLYVKLHASSKLTFDALTSTIDAGDKFTAIPSTFTLEDILAEINLTLKEECKYVATDTTLTVTDDTLEYALPDGVSNVLRVEVATSADSPYNYKRNFWWREREGYIEFDEGREPITADMKIKIWYKKTPEDVDVDSDLPAGILDEFVTWSVVERLWRSYISDTRKDNVISIDMKNEASAKAERALSKKNSIPTIVMSRDPHYSRW